jgi:hypothetical protein
MENLKDSEFFSKLKENQEKLKSLRAELTETIKIEFGKTAYDFLFSRYPKLESFSWRQYTNYFNDGEECYFSANVDDLEINGFTEYEDDELEEDGRLNILLMSQEQIWKSGSGNVHNEMFDEKALEIVNNIKMFLSHFDEDDLKDAFGDHKKVLVMATGVALIDYTDHD